MTLDEFLQELSARRGLHRKIGLVTRYWRQVQSLPADKQQQVALALGSKAAWNRLEKLFAKDGLSDGELAVKRALDRVGAADPDELRDLASKVRSGNYADVSRELVEVVGRALDEEADADETGGVSEDALIDDEAEPPDDVEAIDEPTADDEAAFHEAAPREEGSAEEAPDEAPGLVGEPSNDLPRAAETPVGAAVIASSPPLPGGSTEPERQAPEMVAEPAQPAPEAVAKSARASPEAVPTPVPPSLEVVTEPDTGPTLSAADRKRAKGWLALGEYPRQWD